MVGALIEGADLCMGSRSGRHRGPGAMPWKNRYIGNLRSRGFVEPAVPGQGERRPLRFARPHPRGAFDPASAHRRGDGVRQRDGDQGRLSGHGHRRAGPATSSPRLARPRSAHLQPVARWLAPSALPFHAQPGVAVRLPRGGHAVRRAIRTILASPAGDGTPPCDPAWGGFFFGDYWVVLAGALVGIGHIAAILAGASHLQGVRAGYSAAVDLG